jgi:hypothetical protein
MNPGPCGQHWLGYNGAESVGQDDVGTAHAGHRYDHFLVSPDLASEEAIDARIEVFAGDDLAPAKETSDHMPVMARFRTEERFRDRK